MSQRRMSQEKQQGCHSQGYLSEDGRDVNQGCQSQGCQNQGWHRDNGRDVGLGPKVVQIGYNWDKIDQKSIKLVPFGANSNQLEPKSAMCAGMFGGG